MKRVTLAGVLLIVACCVGCVHRRSAPDPAFYIKPTIAVMKFENRAPFPLRWDLGDGMADILVDRLVTTKRYHVIERPELNSVLEELRFQTSGMTREQRRAVLGRIKNVEYLIKGTVTDFGHLSTTSGAFKSSSFRFFGAQAVAVVGMTFYVVDVESGEIITSQSLEEAVRATDVAVAGEYKGVSLGGRVFYRTPLGRATSKVMDRAVEKVTQTIAGRRWRPKIATLGEDGLVILNGGLNRKVRRGQEYAVLELGTAIVDPDTGDEIGRLSSKVLGRLRIREVQKGYSTAQLIEGDAAMLHVGLTCKLVKQAGKPKVAPKRRPRPAGSSAGRPGRP